MTEAFDETFVRLRAVMLAEAPAMKVTRDEPGSLEMRWPQIEAKTGQLGWHGTVTIKKGYVAVHLMALYTRPELAADLSPALAKRRQGKTCFNFSKVDEVLFGEIEPLMIRCGAFLPMA